MTSPTLAFDRTYGRTICGIDEAGRGPWAGPVVAAAVIWPEGTALPDALNDSKKLSAKKREALYEIIQANARVGIGEASAAEIDELNILQASLLAMQRAYEDLIPPPACGGREFIVEAAVIDGNHAPKLPCPTHTIIKGDSLSPSIAAASIIAKVTRDNYMAELAREHPGYGFERHAGYGTKQHAEALARAGVTPHHRRSFAPIRKLLMEAA